MDIKVLGPGCPKCKTAEKVVRETIKNSNINANIEKISDPMKIASFGVFGTPAIIVNGDVKSVGKIPSEEEILEWTKD